MAGSPAVRPCAGRESQRNERLSELVGLHRRGASECAREETRSRAEFSEGVAAPRPHAGIPLHAFSPLTGRPMTRTERIATAPRIERKILEKRRRAASAN